MAAARVDTAAELGSALDRTLEAQAPGLIEVPVGDLPDIWTLIKRPPSQG